MSSIVQQIRDSLRDSGERLTLAQLADANDWDGIARNYAAKQLFVIKTRGEIDSQLEEGKPAYALVAGYAPKIGGRKSTRGPDIHVGRSDKKAKVSDAGTPAGIARANGPVDEAAHAIGMAPTLQPKRQKAKVVGLPEPPNVPLKLNLIADEILQALRDVVADDNCKSVVAHLLDAHQAMKSAALAYPAG